MADMKLVDGGAHSVGVNNDNSRQYVSATPKGTLTSVVEFTNVGGVLGQPTVQNASSGLISTGTELWFKNSGSSTLVRTEVGGVSESGGGTTTSYSQTSSNDYMNFGANANQKFYKMQFTPSTTGNVNRVTVKTTNKNGSGVNRSVTAYIYADNGGGASAIPTGSPLATSDALTDGLTVAETEYTFTFPNAVSLTSGTLYWIVLVDSAPTSGNFIGLYYSGSVTTYILAEGASLSTNENFSFKYGAWLKVAYVSLCTYTLSSLSPALTGAIGDWVAAYKVRTDKTKPLMYLATGQTDEPLVKETSLTLDGSTTASQVVVTSGSSLLSYFATGNLSKDIIVTVGGVDSVVQPNGTVTESSGTVYKGVLSSQISTVSGTVTPGAGSVSLGADSSAKLNFSLSGDFDIKFTWASGSVCLAGVRAASDPPSGTGADILQHGNSFCIHANGNFYYGNSFTQEGSTTALSNGDVVRFYRSGSTVKIDKNGTLVHTFTGATYSGDMVFCVGANTGSLSLSSLQYMDQVYTTTIPIATQASAPTAAKIADRFTTAVDIDTVTYVTGPELDVAGETTTLTDDPTLKRLALKVRGDTAVGVRSKDWMIETTEKAG